jgi:hypothetical protein
MRAIRNGGKDTINDAGQRSVTEEVLKHENNQPHRIDEGVPACQTSAHASGSR